MLYDYFKKDSQGRRYAGDHILLEIAGAKNLDNISFIEQKLTDAAKLSGASIIMTNFHGFGDGQGVTGVVVLAESHITIHTWPEHGFAAIDIFMCGKANAFLPIKYLVEAFEATKFDYRVDRRGFMLINY